MKILQGKAAFITGGASGIGLGIAQAFVDAGMKVVLADLRQDHIDHAVATFTERGHRQDVHAIRLDCNRPPRDGRRRPGNRARVRQAPCPG